MEMIVVAAQRPELELAGRMRSATVNLAGVDWGREIVVVVDMGEQRTGGYGVRLLEARLAAPDRVELSLEVQRPEPGSFAIQAFTHPYTVVRIPRAWLGSGSTTLVACDQGGDEIVCRVVRL